MRPILTMTDLPPSPVAHNDSLAVAAFLDGRLRGRSRDALIAHLAECAECRREVVELRRALGEPGHIGTAKRRLPLTFIGAIAAVLLVSILVPKVRTARTTTASNEDRVRAGAATAGDPSAPMVVIEPADGATIAGNARTFVWRPAGRDAMYVVTVQDSVGTGIWNSTGVDTSFTLPDSVPLQSGARYFWSVQAQRADGYTTKSVLHSFQAK